MTVRAYVLDAEMLAEYLADAGRDGAVHRLAAAASRAGHRVMAPSAIAPLVSQALPGGCAPDAWTGLVLAKSPAFPPRGDAAGVARAAVLATACALPGAVLVTRDGALHASYAGSRTPEAAGAELADDATTVTSVAFSDMASAYTDLAGELDAAVDRVLAGGILIGGPEVETFEAEFAGYCGARHAVGVANGLDALHLVLRAYDVGEGDEVIVPSNTYIASWLAVSYAGARPVPVEPDASTYNLDPTRVEAAITPRTRAIMPVHLYGQPADMDPLLEIGARYGLRIVEDAAQAHGARYRGRIVGSLGDATAFSLYPTKNLGALGDAGVITTDDDGLADRLRVLRNYGSRIRYHNEVQGYNSRLDPLQAAMLGVKLRRLDGWNARRAELAQLYADRLRGTPGLTLPHAPAWAMPVWHLFVVRHPRRDALQEFLRERGVGTLIHYPVPPHLSGAYAALGWERGSWPIAEAVADTALSLPIGPHLRDADVVHVADEVREFCER